MLSIAGLLLVAGQLFDAASLAALESSDDARAVPYVERALERSIAELGGFPAALPPTDLEDEIEAALMALERFDPESALASARVLANASVSARLSLVARRVAARRGDSEVVRTALGDYFLDPEAGRLVLGDAAAAANDIRLRDFRDYSEPRALATNQLLRTTLLRRLGDELAPPGPSVPEDLGEGDALTIQGRVLALAPKERYRALRWLASEDDAALVGLPVDAATIDRLYPYLARSRYRALRDRVRRARSVRGEALASLLLSPVANEAEKRAHAHAMRDAWSAAVVAVGQDIVSPIVGTEFAFEAESMLDEPRALGSDDTERTIRELASAESRNPDALAAMYRFYQRYPARFLPWLDARDDALRERAGFVLALSGDARRLPLLIALASAGGPPPSKPAQAGLGPSVRDASRDAAFRGLAEVDLGSFDKRLHRLAGSSERSVRFRTALALAPANGGEEWALRLLFAELDEASVSERLRVRRALERLPGVEAFALLGPMVSDGTATPFALELFVALAVANGLEFSPGRVWEILAPHVADEELIALLVAARLGGRGHPGARAAVARYLERQ